MAVIATIVRQHHTETAATTQEFCTLTLSGPYTTGGFPLKPFGIVGGPGSSPLAGSKLYEMRFYSPTGYIYVQALNGVTSTVKIYSAPGTELANGTAVPDASVPVSITKSKV